MSHSLNSTASEREHRGDYASNVRYVVFFGMMCLLASPVASHDVSDDEFCAAFNDEHFDGANEFGHQLTIEYDHHDYLKTGRLPALGDWPGSVALSNAKILPCRDRADPSYADDGGFCLYKRFEGIEGLEDFPSDQDWSRTLAYNERRSRFLEICPVEYSDTEKQLFLLQQEKDISNDAAKAVTVAAAFYLRGEVERCVETGKTDGRLEAMRFQYQLEEATRAAECAQSGAAGDSSRSLGSIICRRGVPSPESRVMRECGQEVIESERWQVFLSSLERLTKSR